MAKLRSRCGWLAVLVALVAVQGLRGQESIARQPFGMTKEGQHVSLFVLKNHNGIEADITNYGGIVTALHVPDRDGKDADIVLGFDRLDRYLAGSPYFGATIGRYGNRIAKGTFKL